jgi:tetratricopeptide (TPR) repeat protein
MRVILIGLALALVSGPAWAQSPQQYDWCGSPSATDDQRIAGCTAVIQSGRETTADQAGAYSNRGWAYYNKGLYDQTIADETRAIALQPGFAFAYSNRGAAYFAKGLFDQAIADETRAIAFQPGLAQAYNNRGLAYTGKHLYDQAIADYAQATGLNPGFALAYANRGLAYENTGARDPAIADYRAALKLDPNMQAARDGLTRLGATP